MAGVRTVFRTCLNTRKSLNTADTTLTAVFFYLKMRKKPLSSKQLKQMLFSNDNETFYTMQRTLVIQEIIIEKC